MSAVRHPASDLFSLWPIERMAGIQVLAACCLREAMINVYQLEKSCCYSIDDIIYVFHTYTDRKLCALLSLIIIIPLEIMLSKMFHIWVSIISFRALSNSSWCFITHPRSWFSTDAWLIINWIAIASGPRRTHARLLQNIVLEMWEKIEFILNEWTFVCWSMAGGNVHGFSSNILDLQFVAGLCCFFFFMCYIRNRYFAKVVNK